MTGSSQKDLFDDSTMSFGEHLEELRVRLWKGLVGLALGVIVMLFFGNELIAQIRVPIDNALKRHAAPKIEEEEKGWWETIQDFWTTQPISEVEDPKALGDTESERHQGIIVEAKAGDLVPKIHAVYPEIFKEKPTLKKDQDEKIEFTLWAEEFAQFKDSRERGLQPITLTVQEAFMTYIKVSVVAGLVVSAPWLFYQLWMFVAAGLYPHEKRYVHVFLPLSTFLFLLGASFCFYAVFPFVLDFLLSFNEWLNTAPQIRLSEWISFALMLPLMFGLSFQLPLVMLFLERITVFEVKTYREQRRMAIFVISILSMLLTPSDPMSMILMMVPLCLLYELGILMCRFMESKKPFEPEPDVT